jgi:hypothetical protein
MLTKITLSAMVVDPPSPSYGATRRVPVFGVRGRTNSNDESGFAGFLLRQGYGGQVFFDIAGEAGLNGKGSRRGLGVRAGRTSKLRTSECGVRSEIVLNRGRPCRIGFYPS